MPSHNYEGVNQTIMNWFETTEGDMFRLDKVIHINTQNQPFALLDGGKVTVDLTSPEAEEVKRRVRESAVFSLQRQ